MLFLGCAHFGGDTTEPSAGQAQQPEQAPATAKPERSPLTDDVQARGADASPAAVVEEERFENVTTNGRTQISPDQGDQKQAQPILDEALGYCEPAQEFWQQGELEKALEALDHGVCPHFGHQ